MSLASETDTDRPPRYSELELPRWSCLPGHVAVADHERLAAAVGDTSERIDPGEVAGQRAFRYGVDLFNAGFFWEAHEVWEPVWMALAPNSRERMACQALIQAANACLKLRFGRASAFARLAVEIDRLAGEATVRRSKVAGIDFQAWRVSFQMFAKEAVSGPALDYGFLPASVAGFPFVTLDDGAG